MQVTHHENGTFILSEVEPPLQEMLADIPLDADSNGNRAAENRLFPAPTASPDDADLHQEWREYVTPELRHWFETAAATVESDLQPLPTEQSVTIPANHLDAWLNALNQARLALAASHGIDEPEMERPMESLGETPRDFALYKIHFYGFLQECLIQGIR